MGYGRNYKMHLSEKKNPKLLQLGKGRKVFQRNQLELFEEPRQEGE